MAATKKRSSIKKRTPKKNAKSLGVGIGLGVGLSALAAIAYKKGLFDKLADQIKGNMSPVSIQMEKIPESIADSGIEQKLSQGKIQENYMLGNISKVLRKPITEIKAEGITQAELTELRKNNIELDDIKPFVKILNK